MTEDEKKSISKESYNEGFRDGQKVTNDYYREIINKLKCCENCKNKKYTERPQEVTVCSYCKNKSNWELGE